MMNNKLEQLNQELELKRNKLAEQAVKLQNKIAKGADTHFLISTVERINTITKEIVEIEKQIENAKTVTIQEGDYTVTILDSKVTITGENVKATYSIVQNELLLRRNATIEDSNYYREHSKTLVAYWTKKGRTSQAHKDILKEIDQIVVNAVHSVNRDIIHVQ